MSPRSLAHLQCLLTLGLHRRRVAAGTGYSTRSTRTSAARSSATATSCRPHTQRSIPCCRRRRRRSTSRVGAPDARAPRPAAENFQNITPNTHYFQDLSPNSHCFQNTPLECEFSSFRNTPSPSVSRPVVLRPPGAVRRQFAAARARVSPAITGPSPPASAPSSPVRRRPRQPAVVARVSPAVARPSPPSAHAVEGRRRGEQRWRAEGVELRRRRLDRRRLGARWRQPGAAAAELGDELAGVGKDELAGVGRTSSPAWGRTSSPAARFVRANGARWMN